MPSIKAVELERLQAIEEAAKDARAILNEMGDGKASRARKVLDAVLAPETREGSRD